MPKTTRTCQTCGKSDFVFPSRAIRKFCSRACYGNRFNTESRFWSSVHRCDDEHCWIWIGPKQPYGYGVFSIKKRKWLAHRLSFKLTYGCFDSNMQVLHHCDNPSCVRPSHLFLGTPKDNMDDKVRKGRQLKGETVPQSKLTEDDIRAIRSARSLGETLTSLATRFNVTDNNILHITLRRTWRHVV